MIYAICIGVLAFATICSWVIIHNQMNEFDRKFENLEQMIVKTAECTAELSNRTDGIEDYVKMVRSETENDKHSDYWASVMNYNPYLEKQEGK